MARGKIHNINLAAPPEVLTVAPGDIVRVTTEFDYAGPALSARMISAIWHPTFFDPHDEIVRGNKSFSIPSSPPPGNHISVTMDLLVPSGEVGTDYGLYSSIRDIPGPDIYTQYYSNIITIEEVVPEVFKGTISKKELEYNESRGAIPVSNVPQGKRGLVHVWGRNDMAINQKLGISWVVRDPAGLIVKSYSDWQTFSATPGGTHEFIGGRFDINKTGNWTIAVGLFMNPASPIQVASYSGVLCTVGAPPAEYTLEVTIEPPGYGYVTKSPSKAKYSAGEKVTLTAHPYSGYEFDHWGGWPPYPGVGSTSPSIQITMDADWWVVAAFREVVAPVTTITLAIKNPPANGNYWQLVLFNEVWGDSIIVGTHIPVDQPITLKNIPAEWRAPLYIDIMIYENPVSPYNIVYKVQSAYGSDWAYYKDITIPDYGSFYYNVATERFEKV